MTIFRYGRGSKLFLDCLTNYHLRKYMQENWRSIPAFESYEVSDRGRVRSLTRSVPCEGGFRTHAGRVLKCTPNSDGYLVVDLYSSARRSQARVNVLVLQAFAGPRPAGMLACHNDGQRANNLLENLRWGTPQSNVADAIKHGTQVRGTRQHSAKLTEALVPGLRAKRAAGAKLADLAREYGVRACVISEACRRLTWAHVP